MNVVFARITNQSTCDAFPCLDSKHQRNYFWLNEEQASIGIVPSRLNSFFCVLYFEYLLPRSAWKIPFRSFPSVIETEHGITTFSNPQSYSISGIIRATNQLENKPRKELVNRSCRANHRESLPLHCFENIPQGRCVYSFVI